MTIPTVTIDATGVHAPSYEEIRAGVESEFRFVYGDDVALDPDTQDGQLVGIFSLALADVCASVVNAYNTVSPRTAQGTGLSRIVTINGIARRSPSRSTVDLLLSGTVGTEISEGVVADLLGTKWRIPGVVVIPIGGEVTVTAEAEIEGAVDAASGTVTSILTPTLGWQAATNPTAASPGAPVESDAQLRARQILSTGLPSRTVMDGILAAVAAVPNVTRYIGLENDTASTDSNGIPPHSIALVVEGGDATAIAEVMALKKGPGCGTFGSTTEVVVDSFGVPRDISFSRPTILTILVEISLVALSGYTVSVGNAIRLAVANYISGLKIGEDLYLSRIYVPASLFGGEGSETYNITDILIAVDPGTPAASNIVVDFDEAVFCATTNVTLAVS